MHNSRVQQVLREARAMVGTVRPQTPAVPASSSSQRVGSAASGGLLSSSSSSPFSSSLNGGLHNNNTNTTSNNNSNSGVFPLPPPSSSSLVGGRGGGQSVGGGGGRGERLGSPPGTPPPEMEMLVATDREAKGFVGKSTAVGRQWAQALLSLDVRVRHRAAANIFRHCEDSLLDSALLAVSRGTSAGAATAGINIPLLKSEGALAALLVIARSPHIYAPTTVAQKMEKGADDGGETSTAEGGSTDANNNNNNTNNTTTTATTTASSSSTCAPSSSPSPPAYERLTRVAAILAAAAEFDGLEGYLVTSGAIQTIGEVFARLLNIEPSSSSSARAASAGRSSSAPPTPILNSDAASPSFATASASNSRPPSASVSALAKQQNPLPLIAIANLLVCLRVLGAEFPHHILKVGLVDTLLRMLTVMLPIARGAAAAVAATPIIIQSEAMASSSSAQLATNTNTSGGSNSGSQSRPTSGAFVSRFAFPSSSSSSSSKAPSPSGPTAPSSSSSSSAAPSPQQQCAKAIIGTIVRIFCHLSFEDDCLSDFRGLSPLSAPQREDGIAFLEPFVAVLSDAISPKAGGSKGEAAVAAAAGSDLLFLSSPSSLLDVQTTSRLLLLLSRVVDGQTHLSDFLVEFYWEAVVGAVFACLQRRHELRALVLRALGVGPASASAPQPEVSQYVDTVTSDVVVAALALLSNITMTEVGGFTLATSMPHMQCIMGIVNTEDGGEEEEERERKEKSLREAGQKAPPPSPAVVLLKKQAKDNRRTIVRYALMVLSNLSYHLTLMDPLDEEEEAEAAARVAAGSGADNDNDDDDDETPLYEKTRRGQLVTALCLTVSGFLFEGDAEATVEATRVLGNLSRTFEGKAWMEENCADEALVLFLGHEDPRLVYNALGVLLNLTAPAPPSASAASDDNNNAKSSSSNDYVVGGFADGEEASQTNICNKTEGISLLLQHTQRLVSNSATPWEIKELVQMLLLNISAWQNTRGGGVATPTSARIPNSSSDLEEI